MKNLILLVLVSLVLGACSPNWWRCSYGNPSNWDANTLEFYKYYKTGNSN